MKDPTVTIVVPTYKRLRHLQEALPSALRQTFRDFELIVSDDGPSPEIARYVASLGDDRIRYRSNERTLGIALNNLAAFREAKGKYLANLHDDDVWEPRFLEALVPPLEADEEITVAFCDHYLIDENGRVLPERTEANSRFFRRDQLRAGRHQPFLKEVVIDLALPMGMAALFRKSILAGDDFPRRVRGGYDHWLSYLAVREGQACYYVPERLTRYRVHADSGTARGGVRNHRDALYVRSKFLQDPRLAAYRPGLRNALGVLYGKMALFYLERGSLRRAQIFLRQAFPLMNRPSNMLALMANALLALVRRRTAQRSVLF
jgi:glycosyltransferase involved in cell wall biosynthesis